MTKDEEALKQNFPKWNKCKECSLDGTHRCKVVTEKVKDIEHCRGPYKKEKPRRRRR